MSRTYRKTDKGNKKSWLPDYNNRCKDMSQYLETLAEYRYYQDQTLFVSDEYFYWMTTPSHHIREYMTVPQRAKTRNLIKKIYTDPDNGEEFLFPLAKKPHIYYW